MQEFLNRIEAQRTILEVVNSHHWHNEPLFGLTKKSLDRWMHVNKNQIPDLLVSLLFNAADKLYFLANKSQEQITDDYKNLSSEVYALTNEIKRNIPQAK